MNVTPSSAITMCLAALAAPFAIVMAHGFVDIPKWLTNAALLVCVIGLLVVLFIVWCYAETLQKAPRHESRLPTWQFWSVFGVGIALLGLMIWHVTTNGGTAEESSGAWYRIITWASLLFGLLGYRIQGRRASREVDEASNMGEEA